ncbi:NAD-P-binding protein [Mycena epipterygia]|nr:NAD-P-binding protein [Mycena epipterygia]
MSSNSITKKLILVIGATGAQGQAVIDALLAPDNTGAASPYRVRALTRDLKSKHAQALAARGVECVKGSFVDAATVARALEGAYGAWVNTDGFTVGAAEETYAGMRIFEIAKQTPSLRHYVWSNLRYVLKARLRAGFNPDYHADHMNAKGRVGEWLDAQPSVLDGLSWTQVTTGPYMDMLNGAFFRPLNVRADGTVVFAAPVDGGRVPMIALKDLGWWARYAFDHRVETSARELNITSERVGWDYLVETFTKVTGKRAVFKRLTLDEWSALHDDRIDNPIANEKTLGDGSTTIRQNSSAFWRVMRDDIIDKDMEWIRSIHPETYTLERWMRENKYDGTGQTVLKNTQDKKNLYGLKPEAAALL